MATLSRHVARHWFLKAADLGHTEAQRLTGLYYCHDHTPESLKRSTIYLSLASGAGDAEATCQLGWHYENGIGVPVNNKEAFACYKLASDMRRGWGSFLAGRFLHLGKGVGFPDLKLAIGYYEKGAFQKSPHAQLALGLVYYNDGTRLQLAYQLFKEASESIPTAMIALGNCYFWGRGVSRNEGRALELYASEKQETCCTFKLIMPVNFAPSAPLALWDAVTLGKRCNFENDALSLDDEHPSCRKRIRLEE